VVTPHALPPSAPLPELVEEPPPLEDDDPPVPLDVAPDEPPELADPLEPDEPLEPLEALEPPDALLGPASVVVSVGEVPHAGAAATPRGARPRSRRGILFMAILLAHSLAPGKA
jgi:hypothetical protein